MSLPTKESELLRLAVRDARAVAKMKTRKLDMFQWHTPVKGRRCAMCMAGAVMDRTLKVSPKKFLLPQYTGEFEALIKINLMRKGCTSLPEVNALIDSHFNDVLGRAPWRIYLQAADMLEAAGL